jgi:hypothetical protein
MAWNLLFLPAPSADPFSLLTPRPWGDHTLLPQTRAKGPHTPPPTWDMLASVWTVGDYPDRHTEVRIKQDFTSVPESSWLRRKLHRKVQQTHIPPHTWGMVASVCSLWPQCGHLETTQAVTLKSGSNMTLLQFLNLPGFGGNCIRKFSYFSVGVGAGCTGLPAGLPIKENLGGPVVSLQPGSTPPHPSWTQPELHHLDTVC